MEIFKIVLFATVSVVVAVVVKQLKSEFFLPVVVCAGVILTIMICDKLFDVVYTFYDLSSSAGIDDEAITCVIKVVGIGYVAEFSNSLCVDAGCKSIGDKVLLASKVSILLCSLPIVEKLFALIQNLLS